MKSVLVVDDEPKIVQLARDYLEHAGFAVSRPATAGRPSARRERSGPDLVVLDLGLPEIDGLDVARTLRRESDVPIVMLTARDDELDRVIGPRARRRRLRDEAVQPARARREGAGRAPPDRAARPSLPTSSAPATCCWTCPGCGLRSAGRTVDLTATEFELLATIARQPGRIFTRSQLLDALHGVAFESYERAIDTHVKNLRRKLEPDPRQPRYILTVYGVGYRFADDAT